MPRRYSTPGESIPAPPEPRPRASLLALFHAFLSIGLMSFGGGLAAWIRREVVERRAWLDDKQFLTGYALSQIVPGASNVNLAVFIGAQLRGVAGVLAALAGLMLVPIVLILGVGTLYLRSQATPGWGWIGTALAGMGAVAIGLNIATGIRLAQSNLRGVTAALVTLATTVSIGVLRVPLVEALAVIFPISLALSIWQGGRR
jgi:chromate transporter